MFTRFWTPSLPKGQRHRKLTLIDEGCYTDFYCMLCLNWCDIIHHQVFQTHDHAVSRIHCLSMYIWLAAPRLRLRSRNRGVPSLLSFHSPSIKSHPLRNLLLG